MDVVVCIVRSIACEITQRVLIRVLEKARTMSLCKTSSDLSVDFLQAILETMGIFPAWWSNSYHVQVDRKESDWHDVRALPPINCSDIVTRITGNYQLSYDEDITTTSTTPGTRMARSSSVTLFSLPCKCRACIKCSACLSTAWNGKGRGQTWPNTYPDMKSCIQLEVHGCQDGR